MAHFASAAAQPRAEEGESCLHTGTCVKKRFSARIPLSEMI